MPENSPTPPIVLKLWAHDTPNSGLDTTGASGEAADLILEMLDALEYLVSLGGGDCLDPARAAIAKARGGLVVADDDRPICVGCGQRLEWSDDRWTSDDDGVAGCPACFTEDGSGLCWSAQAAIAKATGAA